VTHRRRAWAAATLALAWLATASALASQTSASVDAALSRVEYDQFQPSWAASVTPAVEYDRGWTSIAARGTLLRFESGHRSLHGSLVASTFAPLAGPARLELGVLGGASRYFDFASFSNLVARARVHFLRPARGIWVGGSGGRATFGRLGRAVAVAEAGAWLTRSPASLTISATKAWVGDTTYTDLEGVARYLGNGVELEGVLGARVWSRGAGRGVYGEASATLPLTARVALVAGGGRYPTDPSSGGIAGRYFSLAVRLLAAPLLRRGRAPAANPLFIEGSNAPPEDPASDVPSIQFLPQGADAYVLKVRSPGAASVEVMGDFTDWLPVSLRAAGDAWQATFALGPGPHRLEIRIDGGVWTAPAGTTCVADEFGGDVGVIVVP